jgi:hypothetical protein
MKCPNCDYVFSKSDNLKENVFFLHQQGMTVAEIVCALTEKGFFKHYRSNPAISVHSTLRDMNLEPNKKLPELEPLTLK